MIVYEWNVEEVVTVETDDILVGDIIDHNHQTSFADCVGWANDTAPAGSEYRIVLVRDVLDKYDCLQDRAWAYLDNGKLPEYFEDAYGVQVAKVPARFVKEASK